VAETVKDARGFLFLGRGANYPVALEGALKLKEISSTCTPRGYPAGEMKHGPIAVDRGDEDFPARSRSPPVDRSTTRSPRTSRKFALAAAAYLAPVDPGDDRVAEGERRR
jgi:hypothetical protein